MKITRQVTRIIRSKDPPTIARISHSGMAKSDWPLTGVITEPSADVKLWTRLILQSSASNEPVNYLMNKLPISIISPSTFASV